MSKRFGKMHFRRGHICHQGLIKSRMRVCELHRPAESGERLAKLVSNSDALTSEKYYSDGQAKPSSPLSYSKENAIDLWNTSAGMVGLSPDIATIQPELVSNPLKDLSAKECHG
jgi:hypothetical protein